MQAWLSINTLPAVLWLQVNYCRSVLRGGAPVGAARRGTPQPLSLTWSWNHLKVHDKGQYIATLYDFSFYVSLSILGISTTP